MLDLEKDLLAKLVQRDSIEKKNSQFYDNFYELSRKTNELEHELKNIKELDVHLELQEITSQNGLIINENEKYKEIIKSQESQIHVLNRQVEARDKQANKVNHKLNDVVNEVSEKNKTIEIINDEILSLNIENNSIRNQLRHLAEENEQLIQRWMNKVTEDAEKLNDANAFLER